MDACGNYADGQPYDLVTALGAFAITTTLLVAGVVGAILIWRLAARAELTPPRMMAFRLILIGLWLGGVVAALVAIFTGGGDLSCVI